MQPHPPPPSLNPLSVPCSLLVRPSLSLIVIYFGVGCKYSVFSGKSLHSATLLHLHARALAGHVEITTFILRVVHFLYITFLSCHPA